MILSRNSHFSFPQVDLHQRSTFTCSHCSTRINLIYQLETLIWVDLPKSNFSKLELAHVRMQGVFPGPLGSILSTSPSFYVVVWQVLLLHFLDLVCSRLNRQEAFLLLFLGRLIVFPGQQKWITEEILLQREASHSHQRRHSNLAY